MDYIVHILHHYGYTYGIRPQRNKGDISEPKVSKQKVQVEVDKQSVKAAQKAINDLFAPLAKWFK